MLQVAGFHNIKRVYARSGAALRVSRFRRQTCCHFIIAEHTHLCSPTCSHVYKVTLTMTDDSTARYVNICTNLLDSKIRPRQKRRPTNKGNVCTRIPDVSEQNEKCQL